MDRPSLRLFSRVVAMLLAWRAVTGSAAEPNPLRQITVMHRDGQTIAGTLGSLENGTLTLEGAEPSRIPTKSLIQLRFRDRQAELLPRESQIILTDGCQLAARVVATDDESIALRWLRFPVWDEFRLPLETVRGIVFLRPDTPEADARLHRLISGHRERHDLLILANGDTLTGEFVRLEDQKITLETTSGKSEIDRSGVRAIAFNASLTNVERLTGEGALVTLTDGSHFRARELKSLPLERLECRTISGARFALPTMAIVSLRFLGGCATYLSDLEPSKYVFTPYLGLDWPIERDRNVRGGPLQLRGAFWPKGLGTHSQCEITYRLDGQYRRFQATIGIDDDTEGKGSARFEILVDGKPVFASEEIHGASAPLPIDRIDLTKARTLTLRVNYGLLGDIQDHANWYDALLVK